MELETNASDLISAGVLWQQASKDTLHPVIFYSKKHSLAKADYEIYNKNLMIIVRAFKELGPELELVAQKNPI